VGNVLQYRQILRPHPASATEPARAPAGRIARCGALRASSGRAGADWGASCFGGHDRWCATDQKPSSCVGWDISKKRDAEMRTGREYQGLPITDLSMIIAG